MGETRVDLQHLLEDLRDAYTGALEETMLTEVVANALDSGASVIRLATSSQDATLTIVDDGRGMQRRELARYHDVAASTKSRGEGIGFAGVGIKLGLLVAREVVTETKRGSTHVATRWHLASRHRAPWKWIPPPGVEFEVDGQRLRRDGIVARDRVTIPIRIGRRRPPSAIASLERHELPLSEEQQGIAISTFGKVITRGWDWLGPTPATPVRVAGLVEAPDHAVSLTLSKNDFVIALTVALALAPLAVGAADEHAFITQFLAHWGGAHAGRGASRTRRRARSRPGRQRPGLAS